MTPDAVGEWVAPYRPDLGLVLGPFLRGQRDPSWRGLPDGSWWWVTRTPDGPGSLRLRADEDAVSAASWGPGAQWLVGNTPVLLGFDDDWTGFPGQALPEALRESWRHLVQRWRTPRSGRVLEALVAAILEQKVTGVEARRAWRLLLVEVGEKAPGPAPDGMHVPPSPAALRAVPSWTWHAWGVQPPMSATVIRSARAAGRIEECAHLSHPLAKRRLRAIDGVGEWTAAEVASRALGDADAVSFGDYHLAKHLVYAFTGAMNGTDEQMSRLLEPFAGHRHRVQRIVETSGVSRPARGPRATITDHRRR